uniref:Uncharacterized protein n=1 Tax=Rhizophora mucronata TaxID=61149 RepID=A0A2P2NE19_RHIMU
MLSWFTERTPSDGLN